MEAAIRAKQQFYIDIRSLSGAFCVQLCCYVCYQQAPFWTFGSEQELCRRGTVGSSIQQMGSGMPFQGLPFQFEINEQPLLPMSSQRLLWPRQGCKEVTECLRPCLKIAMRMHTLQCLHESHTCHDYRR